MRAPIYEFLEEYAGSGTLRFHMPGHKGKGIFFRDEKYDITEVAGADELFSAEGIIDESERNLSLLFNTERSLYSTEGSTLAIKTMLATALCSKKRAGRPLVLAGRNAHKALMYAAAMLDFDIEWLGVGEDLCGVAIDTDALRERLVFGGVDGVYLTSPDYLGRVLDIGSIAEICHSSGVPLLIDNAHGAYLNFLEESRHPITLGADMCCDSAHKTLPVLTPGAYLHIAKGRREYAASAKTYMESFATSSPSYLCLASMDLANVYMEGSYRQRLAHTIGILDNIKDKLCERGYLMIGTEPLKITLDATAFGYRGEELAGMLRDSGMECEFADGDHLVLMLNESNTDEELYALEQRLLAIPQRAPKERTRLVAPRGTAAMTIREAWLSPSEEIPVDEAEGRILASPSVGCPPAVPVAVMGERLTKEHILAFTALGRKTVKVVK